MTLTNHYKMPDKLAISLPCLFPLQASLQSGRSRYLAGVSAGIGEFGEGGQAQERQTFGAERLTR
jgi:hypothetical protein